MKQVEKKIINVYLKVNGDIDLLVFDLDQDGLDKYIVNLNSSSSQEEIKNVFSKLLELLIENDIQLILKIENGYSKGLYKDVCDEYIKELNRELEQVKQNIIKILK